MSTIGDFKLHVEQRYGIAVMYQVWLVKGRDQPLQHEESVFDYVSAPAAMCSC
jgi:hypothetical protein